MPLACFKAVSVESETLVLSIDLLTTNLSTTISMLCHFCLSNSIDSLRSLISPLTRTLMNPDFLAEAKMSLCSPFLLCTTGANIWIRLSFSIFNIESTIC